MADINSITFEQFAKYIVEKYNTIDKHIVYPKSMLELKFKIGSIDCTICFIYKSEEPSSYCIYTKCDDNSYIMGEASLQLDIDKINFNLLEDVFRKSIKRSIKASRDFIDYFETSLPTSTNLLCGEIKISKRII